MENSLVSGSMVISSEKFALGVEDSSFRTKLDVGYANVVATGATDGAGNSFEVVVDTVVAYKR